MVISDTSCAQARGAWGSHCLAVILLTLLMPWWPSHKIKQRKPSSKHQCCDTRAWIHPAVSSAVNQFCSRCVIGTGSWPFWWNGCRAFGQGKPPSHCIMSLLNSLICLPLVQGGHGAGWLVLQEEQLPNHKMIVIVAQAATLIEHHRWSDCGAWLNCCPSWTLKRRAGKTCDLATEPGLLSSSIRHAHWGLLSVLHRLYAINAKVSAHFSLQKRDEYDHDRS